MSEFKKKIPFDQRQKAASGIIHKYEDKRPVYVSYTKNKAINSKELDNNKYILPIDMTLGNFQTVLRKRIELHPENALWVFICIYNDDTLVDSIMASLSDSIGTLYSKYSDSDGFLYITICNENTFG
jgi:GABA(A) receptor-associated protein